MFESRGKRSLGSLGEFKRKGRTSAPSTKKNKGEISREDEGEKNLALLIQRKEENPEDNEGCVQKKVRKKSRKGNLILW